MKPLRMIRLTALTLSLLAALPISAQTLKIGISAEPTSADPHYHRMGANDSFSMHVYDALVYRDADMNLHPGLATDWKNIDDHTWEFNLRKDVKFSNGQPFTAKDVLFTFCRVMNNPTTIAASYTDAVKFFDSVETPNDHKVIIKTKNPLPILPAELGRLGIIWHGVMPTEQLTFKPKEQCGLKNPQWLTNQDFNTGKAAIGTGPYKLVSYVKGTEIKLERNEGYWGTKPHWKEVRMIPALVAGPRLIGLMTGNFDIIENPNGKDLPRIKENPKLSYSVKPSTRLVFFQPDTGRAQSPFVKAPDGKNPLQDVRVRKAIAMAIDRDTINKKIMDGNAFPTSQLMPDGMFGSVPNMPPIPYDPTAAKALLAEAGYPNGFEMTVSSTNDRYINDAQISQLVAQYLARIGITAKVDTMTASLYFTRRKNLEFSFSMGGWPSEIGEPTAFFQLWLSSFNPDKGVGTSNYGRFSNPELDKIFYQAFTTVDVETRKARYQEATKKAMEQFPLIPLHFESGIWAYRADLSYSGRRDQFTLATEILPKK